MLVTEQELRDFGFVRFHETNAIQAGGPDDRSYRHPGRLAADCPVVLFFPGPLVTLGLVDAQAANADDVLIVKLHPSIDDVRALVHLMESEPHEVSP